MAGFVGVSCKWAKGGAGGERLDAATPPPGPASQSMGDSVTPHALITNRGEFRYLISGIDTLDLGVYVNWQGSLVNFQTQLENLRDQAVEGETAVWRDYLPDAAVVRPSSKRNYRYLLKFADVKLWLANTNDSNRFPIVYASPTAKALWLKGPEEVVEDIGRIVSELGGYVERIQISRCDLAADYYMEDAPTLEFLRSHTVSRSKARRPWEDNDKLETFYVGKPQAPIQGRIYYSKHEYLNITRRKSRGLLQSNA